MVIHESIHPVTILKVVVNKAVDYGWGWKFFAQVEITICRVERSLRGIYIILAISDAL